MQQLTTSRSEVLFVGIVSLTGLGLVLWGLSLDNGRPIIRPPLLAHFHPSYNVEVADQIKPTTDDNTDLPCSKWAIVSMQAPPLPPPPPWPYWCLLVLIDSKMPPTPLPLKRVTILDAGWHESNCTFKLCQMVPWRGENKRNIGYLHAIRLGATTILDLEPGSFLEEGDGPERLDEGLVEVIRQHSKYIHLPFHQVIYPSTRVWNPYLHMTDTIKKPPGFPSSYDPWDQQVLTSHMEELARARVGMVQPLGSDPSLRTFPLLALALKTAAPMWGGALYRREAFLTLLLPPSVSAGQAQLWRGYIGQRLLWLMGKHLAFGRPWALIDEDQMEEEEEVWNDEQSSALDKLLQMDLQCETAEECLLQLWNAMKDYGIFSPEDLLLVPAWLDDLIALGFTSPTIKDTREKQFAYLIQGGKASSMANLKEKLGNDPGMNVFTLTFLEPSGDLYYPNSTHLGGRNALLRYALSLERGSGYQYFIFIDEDVKLVPLGTEAYAWKGDMEKHPWRRFEDFLSTFKPTVGFPQYSR